MTPPETKPPDERDERDEGWFKLSNASKWHYFRRDYMGVSLCRKWDVPRQRTVRRRHRHRWLKSAKP